MEKYDPEVSDLIKWRKHFTTRDNGRGNKQKIFAQRPKLDIRKYSFTVRVTNTWNCLPDTVVSAPSMNSFKNRLDKYWANQDVLYNFKSAMNCNTGSHTTSRVRNETTDSGEEDQ